MVSPVSVSSVPLTWLSVAFSVPVPEEKNSILVKIT